MLEKFFLKEKHIQKTLKILKTNCENMKYGDRELSSSSEAFTM